MAIGTYELWLDHWNGTRLAYLDSMLELEYTRVIGGVGMIGLTMPSSFNESLLKEDYKIEVWRGLPGVPKRLENVYVTRGWRKWTDSHGVDKLTIIGVDGNDILKRRWVWTSLDGGSVDVHDDYAADIAKQLVRDALSNSDAGSIRGNLSSYVKVQSNNNMGAKFKKGYADRVLWDAVEACLQTSKGRGSPLVWYMMPLSGSKYEFRVYKTRMGQNRSGSVVLTVDSPLTLMSNEYDYIDQTNLVWVKGGHWTGSYANYRKWEKVYNSSRIRKSPFSYSEMIVDAGEEHDTDHLTEMANEELALPEHLAKEILTVTLQDTDILQYGRDWDLGDTLGISYRGRQTTGTVNAIYVEMKESEKVHTRLKIEAAFTPT